MSLMVLIYLLTSIFYLYIGAFSLMYDKKNKINRIFFVFCLDLALWSMMLMLMNAASDTVTATVFRKTATLFWSLVYCLMLHFLLVLVKKDRFLKKPWNLILFYLPAMFSIFLYYFYDYVSPEEIVKIPGGWAYMNIIGNGQILDYYLPVYYGCYVLASIYLILMWGRQSPLKREKKQAKIIVATIIAVFILGSMTDIVLPVLGIPFLPPLTISFIMIPVFGVWYSIKRYRLMNLSPQNVVFDVLETMQEGMIITDRDHVIRDVNIGALTMLGYHKEEIRNKPVERILPEGCDFNEIGQNNEFAFMLKTKKDKTLPVLISSSNLLDEWGESYGSVFLFQDLTQIKKIQQELLMSHDQLEQKVLERTRALNMANEELKNEIKSRIHMENEITKLAYYDQLTGISNKKLFIDYVNEIIRRNKNKDMSLAILYLDLDSFKMINDTMGHQQGDALIKQVAERLLSRVRVRDSIARIDGDEFLILAQEQCSDVSISTIASSLKDAFKHQFTLSGNDVHITASIGVAMYPVDGGDAETLIRNADIAMCKAKEKGKNKIVICDDSMKSNLQEVVDLTNQLYKAIGRNEFELYYQPQVDIETSSIVGFEALLRWNHPELGLIPPGRFIPIAEKTGLILPIGEWVLKMACKQMKAWHDAGVVKVPVAVNLSAKQFQGYDIMGLVSRTLSETGLSPEYLELEITESALMEDTQAVSKTLERLNQLGIRISIDDFGMRYSSLYYLKQIPLNRLKIDMSFVRGITVNRKDEVIIDGMIHLAKNLGINILAEGVETFPQLQFLKNASCTVIQGFYLYRPMNAERISELLTKKVS